MANQNTALVILAKDKDFNQIPITTTEIIANALNKKHHDVIELVRKYLKQLECFGRVSFKTLPLKTKGGTQKKVVAGLNEQQATLLIAMMRNSEKVIQFKMALVKAFFDMRESLAKEQQQKQLDRPKYLPPSTNKIERTSEYIEYDLTTLKKGKESLHWWNEHREEAQEICIRLNYALDVLKKEHQNAVHLLDQFASILNISSHTGETELGRIIAQLEIIDKKRESIPNHIKKAVY